MSTKASDGTENRRGKYHFKNFTLDLERGFLQRDEDPIDLRPKTFEVLAYLVERHGRLVPKNELVDAVWRDTAVTDNSLSQCLVEVRRALGDESQEMIRTVTRRGFIFAAPVITPVLPFPGEAPRPVVTPVPVEVKVPKQQPRTMILATGLLLTLVIGIAVVRSEFSRPDEKPAYTQITDFTDSAVAPALSPDGKMVAFIRGTSFFTNHDQIWVKLLPNGEPMQLTHTPQWKYAPQFSPDGSKIAYTVVDSGWNTFTVSSLGGEPQLLMRNASGLTWLDANRMLFSAQMGSIHMGVVAANESRTESHNVYWPDHQRAMAHFSYASPDRKSALIVEMDYQPTWQACRLVPLDGSSAGRQVGPKGQCTSAGWSPDGKWMYFGVDIDGHHHLWRQRFPDGAPEQITSGVTDEDGIAVAPDGRSLITSIGQQQSELWVHDSQGDRAISSEGSIFSVGRSFASGSLQGWASVPTFSPDGRRVYYLLRREPAGTGSELWFTDVDSGARENVLPGFSVVEYDLSHDGSEVVFSTGNDGNKTQIFIATVSRTSPPKRIAEAAVASPHFGLDEQILFRFTDGKVNYLYRMNKDGSAWAKVTPDPIATVQTASPDGHWLAALLPNGDSVAIPVAGGAPVTICHSCYLRWGPTGSFLYVSTPPQSQTESGKTLAIPLASAETLPKLPIYGVRSIADQSTIPGSKILDVSEIVPAPDPSTFAYVKNTVHRNLFRIPLS